MATTRMYELARELLRLSQDNRLAWEQTLRANQFQVDFPDVSLAISYFPSLGSYQLDLINETGSTIESLDWNPVLSPAQTQGETEGPEKTLKEIYEFAEAYVQDVVAQRALQYLKQA